MRPVEVAHANALASVYRPHFNGVSAISQPSRHSRHMCFDTADVRGERRGHQGHTVRSAHTSRLRPAGFARAA